jgi:hypothetical protein
MLKITVEGTTEKDKELIPLLRDHLCYAITDESDINLTCKGWDGGSGGDDAYFGLSNKKVKVETK